MQQYLLVEIFIHNLVVLRNNPNPAGFHVYESQNNFTSFHFHLYHWNEPNHVQFHIFKRVFSEPSSELLVQAI